MAQVTFNGLERTAARWAKDYLGPMTLVPGGARVDPAQFTFEGGFTVGVGAAGAAVDATSIPVDALAGAIPAGTILDFGAKKFAQLTADAAAGATSLTVEALATALVDADSAVYQGTGIRKPIASGTLIGRTYAERDAGTGFGPADAAADDEIYLVAFDLTDALECADVDLYRHNCIVAETFLPDWDTYDSTTKAKIRELYQTTIAAA